MALDCCSKFRVAKYRNKLHFSTAVLAGSMIPCIGIIPPQAVFVGGYIPGQSSTRTVGIASNFQET